MHVQYGCGWSAPDGWVNFDASPTLRFERLPVLGLLSRKNGERFPKNVLYGDVTKKLPVDDDSCDGVYSSHVLEHLPLEDVDKALSETFRILKPGGLFRVVVPDLAAAAEEYLSNLKNGVADANSEFLRTTQLGQEKRVRSPKALVYEWLGNARHLWMWDYTSLEQKLAQHGFREMRIARFNDSEDPAFVAVEAPERFEKACAIQAVKPARQ
jgi:predicted SAM-dependent methyltransferase